MGPGDRFSFHWIKGLCFGITVDSFPYDIFVTVFIGPLCVSVGIGDDYLAKD